MRRVNFIIFAGLFFVFSGTKTNAQPLCGTYMIGSSQPAGFQNLTQALFVLNTQGVSCAVIFELQADYSSIGESFPLVINAIPGASSINNFLLKPASGVNITISGSSVVSIIKLNGADYVSINGSNSGGNSKNLTITNSSTNITSAVIWNASTATDGATNNKIENCIISGNSSTTTLGCIIVSGSVIGEEAEQSNSNLTISNNSLSNAQNGVYAFGNFSVPDENWTITNNIITSIEVKGIAVLNVNQFNISVNQITNVSTPTTSTASGILIDGNVSNGIISRNVIRNIKNTYLLVGWGSNGIQLSSYLSSAAIDVYNNMISDVASYGYLFDSEFDNGYGLIVTSGGGYKIYYNTVHMNTNQVAVDGVPSAFNVTLGVTDSDAIDLRNNIFTNSQTVGNNKYAIYSSAADTVFSTIDYNNYFTAGPNIGYISFTNLATLTDVVTGFGGNTNSKNGQPFFISNTDLHLESPNANNFNFLESKGVVVSVTTDIDGELRPNGIAPDIGADEFTGLLTGLTNNNAPGAILLTLNSGCTGSPYTNVGATQGGSEPFPACQGTAGFKTVWFKFIAPTGGNVRITNDYGGGTMGSDSRLALYSVSDVNNYATFINIACDDDNGVTQTDRSVIYASGLIAGNTYYIQADGKDISTQEGIFCLTVDELTSAMLSTSTLCTSGQTVSSVNDNYTGWISATDNSGKLVALISNPSGGTTTSTYDNAINVHPGSVRIASGTHYLNRNYTINNSSVSNVNVRFFFLDSELADLSAVDPAVTLSNLQVTRQTGTGCDNDFVITNGINSSLIQSSNGSGTGFHWIEVQSSGLSKFYLHTKRAFVPLKTFLHGAYSSTLARHKEVTTTWRNVLNANALNQPFTIAPFNYAGTESVPTGFFTSTAGVDTDIVDWILIELRSATTPATVISRRAAFIREDGRIVDLDGTSDLSFREVPDNNYYLLIRHRNHLAIRSSAAKALDGTLGFATSLYDFSTAQGQAFQNTTNTVNPAQRNLTGGVFGLWGGNGNSDGQVRATGLDTQNDYLFMLLALNNEPATSLSNVYNRSDFNLDGSVRATGLEAQNDYLFLISALDNTPTKIINQHQ